MSETIAPKVAEKAQKEEKMNKTEEVLDYCIEQLEGSPTIHYGLVGDTLKSLEKCTLRQLYLRQNYMALGEGE
jgi:nucleoid-associated protein YejK